MGRAFQEELDKAASDDSVRCIVITGEGRAFCAGQDLKEVTAPDAPNFKVIVEETYNASIRRICAMRKPILAAVNGVAAGAGANIALACDLTIASEEHAKKHLLFRRFRKSDLSQTAVAPGGSHVWSACKEPRPSHSLETSSVQRTP